MKIEKKLHAVRLEITKLKNKVKKDDNNSSLLVMLYQVEGDLTRITKTLKNLGV